VLLVRNTPWAHTFFRAAHQAQQHPAAMAPFLAEDIQLHGERNATLEQASQSAGGFTPQPYLLAVGSRYMIVMTNH
jgi:hypothetical protein